MATIVNYRDVVLQATGTRMVTVSSPSNILVDFGNVNGTTKPSDNADVTVTAVNGGVVVTGGGITLSSGGSIKGGQTAYNSGVGFFLGYSSSTYRLSVGDSSGDQFTWSGSTLNIVGALTGTGSINITGNARFKGAYTGVGGTTMAVYANESGAAVNGVYGITTATLGTLAATGAGVYGSSSGGESVGVRGVSDFVGVYGVGNTGAADAIRAVHNSVSGTGFSAYNKGAAAGCKEFHAATASYAAFSPSGGGKYFFTDGIGPFTGMHPGLAVRGTPFEIGDLVYDVEVIWKPDVNNAWTIVATSTHAEQPGICGVVNEIKELTVEVSYEKWWEWAMEDDYVLIDFNGTGEGLVNVCGQGGDIEVGDLGVSSNIPGKAMRQSDRVMRAETVVKFREKVTFDSPDEVKQAACFYRCG